MVPSGEDRYYLTTFNTGVFSLRLRLPEVGFPPPLGLLAFLRTPGVLSVSSSGPTR